MEVDLFRPIHRELGSPILFVRKTDGSLRMYTDYHCGSWLAISKLRAQICFVPVDVAFHAKGSANDGGEDVKMFHCLVFNSRL
jgi:hypothetical protein